MTHRERFNAVMHFKPVDRIPNEEFGYWGETLERWRLEGMPVDADEELYFGLDIRRERRLFNPNCGPIPNSPYGFDSLESLEKAKPYYYDSFDSPERYPANWAEMVENYKNRDYPLGLNFSGFFGQPRGWLGLARTCTAYYEEPEFMHALGEFWADVLIGSMRRAMDDVQFDFIQVWEDMAYNHGSLISPKTFREFMTPYYRKVTDFIHSKGVDVILCDCDGDTNDMVELFLEAGVNGLYPLERVAGTDPFMIREKYPEYLLLGGISKIEVGKGPDAIDAHLKDIPKLIDKGGFIPFVDHRVPSDVTMANFIYYQKVKREIIGGDLGVAQCDFTNAREEALKPANPFEYKPQGVGPHL